MSQRFHIFPVAFGLSLAVLCVAYYHRKSFFPEVWEKHHQQALESHKQAIQFKASVAEGIKKEREQKQKD